MKERILPFVKNRLLISYRQQLTQKSWSLVLLYYFCIKVVFMSDRIYTLIDGIREKVSLMQNQLSVERSSNEELRAEVSSLTNNLISKEEEINILQAKIEDLSKNVKAESEQSVVASSEKGISDEQIDELVKEIEYCIGQLKK